MGFQEWHVKLGRPYENEEAAIEEAKVKLRGGLKDLLEKTPPGKYARDDLTDRVYELPEGLLDDLLGESSSPDTAPDTDDAVSPMLKTPPPGSGSSSKGAQPGRLMAETGAYIRNVLHLDENQNPVRNRPLAAGPLKGFPRILRGARRPLL